MTTHPLTTTMYITDTQNWMK